jgi:hypothetical protein
MWLAEWRGTVHGSLTANRTLDGTYPLVWKGDAFVSQMFIDLGYCIIDGYDKALCLSSAEEGKLAKMPVQERRDAGMTAAR